MFFSNSLKMLFFVSLLLPLTLVAQAQTNKLPIIKPYITLVSPTDLGSIRVNIEKSNDPDGTISRTEVNFGDGFISTGLDTTHTYNRLFPYFNLASEFQISIKVWDNKNAVSYYSQKITVNPDFKMTNAATVFGPIQVDKKKYSFSASALATDHVYKLVLTRTKTTNTAQNILVYFLNLFNIQTELNTFSLEADINDINLFSTGEISENTMIIEKFISLESANQLRINFASKKYNEIKLEIQDVHLIRETVAPVLTLEPMPSGNPTNIKNYEIKILDDSRVSTIFKVNNGPLSQTNSKQGGGFSISQEGLNVVEFQSIDSFGNRSQTVFNIFLDSVKPTLLSVVPNADQSFYTNTLPYSLHFSAKYNEELQSASINGVAANLSSDKKEISSSLQISSNGLQQIQLQAVDLAGNITNSTSTINTIYWTEKPRIITAVGDSLFINQLSYTFSATIESGIPTSTVIKVNDAQVFSTDLKNIQYTLSGLHEGANSVSIFTIDAAGNASLPKDFIIHVDSMAPELVSLDPLNEKIFYTNQLPLTIPVSAIFNEALSSATVNGTVAVISAPSTISAQVQANQAGELPLQISVSDFSGNSKTVSKSYFVEYSTVKPKLTLDPDSVDILTNKISIPVSGTSDQVLSRITLNGQTINIGPDGKSFSGVFDAPQDGRFQLQFEGTDKFGNSGTVSTYARVLQLLPEDLVNYPAPILEPAYPGRRVDFGPGFSGGAGGDICAALDTIFEDSTEFSDNLRNITTVDPQPYLKKFPKSYQPKIPDIKGVQDFIGDVDEKLNYVKAGYLAVCKGYNFMPDTDCPSSRLYFRLLMGSYPEPLLIRSIPGLDPAIQSFLIKRINICTGFDDSGLTCQDMVTLLPFLSNFVIPGLGEVLGSPIGQFLLEEAACKELCDRPALKDTPVCKEYSIPKIPVFEVPTDISFTPDTGDIGSLPGGDNWGGGGGGDGSDCDWWEDCSGDDDGGNSDGGSSHDDGYFCSQMPNLWFCENQADPRGLPTDIHIDDSIDCNMVNSLSFSDIFLPAYNGGSPTTFLTSIISKCSPITVPGFPKRNAPVITLSAPVDQQAVTDTVLVKGYVTDPSSTVKVQGQVVPVAFALNGVSFEVTIPVPQNGVVIVEAVDSWGNAAVPVEVNLQIPVADTGVTDVSSGYNHVCAVVNGGAKCWGNNSSGQLGVGANTDNQVYGLDSNVTAISVSFHHSCAIVNGAAKCWGSNANGQLGDGTNTNSPIPVAVVGLESGVTAIAVGSNHSCAIVNGRAKCWGWNRHGQLGNGTGVSSTVPVDVNFQGEQPVISAISSGLNHVCVITGGAAKCWGLNDYGQAAEKKYGSAIYSPMTVVGMSSSVTTITGGFSHTCALMNESLKCWGANYNGQLGNGNNIDTQIPTLVTGVSSNVSYLASGFYHTCVVDNGAMKCWGANSNGQLGDGSTINSNIPVDAINTNGASKLSGGIGHTCVIVNSQARCWGNINISF